MLGAEPAVDYSLANRTLLFDVDACAWSREIGGHRRASIFRSFPIPSPREHGSAAFPVRLRRSWASPTSTAIVAGSHDQCANALGCGVTDAGFGMSGMGTYLTIVPVFTGRKTPEIMMRWGLNTEHHAVPGRFVSFIYNQGGLLLKWYRDTFARADKEAAEKSGRDVYADLISEIPAGPSQRIRAPALHGHGPPGVRH